MAVTHTSFTAARDWLLQMGAGAAEHNVTLQYCMSLPRHVLQSAGIEAVGRLRERCGDVAGSMTGRCAVDEELMRGR